MVRSVVVVALCLGGCVVSSGDGATGLSGGVGGFPGDDDDDADAETEASPTTGGSEDTGSPSMTSDGTDAADDAPAETGAVGDDSTDGGSTGALEDAGAASTGEVDVGTQPNFGEYSHCLSNAECNVGSCMTFGMPVSDGYCALTCNGANPSPCGDPPPASPLSPTCYGADNGMGGAVYVCALDCSNDQPCPEGMECFTVPQAAAAGGGTVDLCS